MNPDKAAKWEAWIEAIHADAIYLVDRRRWNAVFEQIVKANPKLLAGQTIPDYFRALYADFAVMAIRRMMKKQPDSISLTALLEDLIENHEMLTRAWYRTLYRRPVNGHVYEEDMANRLADSAFAHFAGSAEVVTKSKIESDLAIIVDATRDIVHFTDRLKAHKDRRGLGPEFSVPTFDSLDVAIVILGNMANEYWWLLTGQKSMAMQPLDMTNALEVFGFPWIDPNHPPEISGLV
jgi:hypothetical protein